MTNTAFFAVCACMAIACSGLGKGGFSGLGALSMPILALSIDPVQAAAILLPILIVQDAVSVWAFRHSWDGKVLAIMVPSSAVGIFLGYLLAAKVSEVAVLGAIGLISIIFGCHRLWIERRGMAAFPSKSRDWMGMLFGVTAGFTSQIAHAGGPPYQMWVLPRRLSPEKLVGTTAITFAVMNWMKVPAFVALGQFTRPVLFKTAVLLPVALISTFAGVWLVRRINPARYYTVIYILMVLLGVKLVVDAIRY